MNPSIRHENPYNKLLVGSYSCAIINKKYINISFKEFSENNLISTSCKNKDGILIDNEKEIVFSIPHNNLDGPGMAYILSRVFYNSDTYQNATSQMVYQKGIIDEATYYFTSIKKKPKQSDKQTFTQLFIEKLLNQQKHIKNQSVGLAVAIENPSSLSEKNLFGNSLITLKFQSEELLKLSTHLNKSDWRKLLSKKANITYKMMKRRINPDKENPFDSIIISSLGNLDSFSWYNNIGQLPVALVSTPVFQNFAHIVIWSSGGRQCLSFAYKGDHWIKDDHNFIIDVWKRCLC